MAFFRKNLEVKVETCGVAYISKSVWKWPLQWLVEYFPLAVAGGKSVYHYSVKEALVFSEEIPGSESLV